MSALTWAVLGGSLLATVAVIGVTLWLVVRRVRAAFAEATGAFDRLRPAIERLERDTAVTQRELERLSEALEQLRGADRPSVRPR